MGFTRVVFEGDALLIVEAMGLGSPSWRNFEQLIEYTRIVLQDFQAYEVLYVKR
jgi:hypothetical protein